MKRFRLAIPKLVVYCIKLPLIPVLLWNVLICLSFLGTDFSHLTVVLTNIIGSILLVSAYIYYYYRPAFHCYKITSEGISNRHLTIPWDKVTSCKVYSVEVPRFIRPLMKELTRVCAIPCTKADSYRKLDSRDCVFFEVTKENLLLIDQYCTHKSEDIRVLLRRYSDLMSETKQ